MLLPVMFLFGNKEIFVNKERTINDIQNSDNWYKGFMNKQRNSTLYVKTKWERDSNVKITDKEWNDCCISQWKCTNSYSWREFGWKCLIRFFITPKQKISGSGEETKCWSQCGSEDANHWHILWDCPVIKQYWIEIHKDIENIFNMKIPFKLTNFILGNTDFLPDYAKYLFRILTIACKKTVTRHWLLPDPPTLERWIECVNEIYQMERLTFSLRLQMNTFVVLGSKWVSYVNQTLHAGMLS